MGYLKEDGEKRLEALLSFVADDADTQSLINWLDNVIPALLSSGIPRSVEVRCRYMFAGCLSDADVVLVQEISDPRKLLHPFYSFLLLSQ